MRRLLREYIQCHVVFWRNYATSKNLLQLLVATVATVLTNIKSVGRIGKTQKQNIFVLKCFFYSFLKKTYILIDCWLQWGYIQTPILDQPNISMLLQRVKCPTDVPHLVQLHLEALLICLLLDVIEQNIYYVCCVLSFFLTGGEFQYVFCLPSVFLFIFHRNNWTGENFFFE